MAKSSSFPTIGFLIICLLLATFFSAIHCSVSEGGKSGRDEEERMPKKDLGEEDGKPGKDWESAEEGKQGKDWGSRGGSPGRHWGSGGGGKDWGSGGDKQGKDWGSGGGKPKKIWGSEDIPRRHYVGLGSGGEWEPERGWGSGGGRSEEDWGGPRRYTRRKRLGSGGGRLEKDWGPREGTPEGWLGRDSDSEGSWSGYSSPSYSPCYKKYNHIPHGHNSWCCGSLQISISISPMCWKSESQCTQNCRHPRRNRRHH